MEKTRIISYEDLDVYQRAYKACLIVMKEVVPRLPAIEKYDLVQQLSRSSKGVPRLIAEGYAKKHQKLGFHKYLDDALAESNECQVGMRQCKDIYYEYVDPKISEFLLNEYKIISAQTFKLGQKWTSFHR